MGILACLSGADGPRENESGPPSDILGFTAGADTNITGNYVVCGINLV